MDGAKPRFGEGGGCYTYSCPFLDRPSLSFVDMEVLLPMIHLLVSINVGTTPSVLFLMNSYYSLIASCPAFIEDTWHTNGETCQVPGVAPRDSSNRSLNVSLEQIRITRCLNSSIGRMWLYVACVRNTARADWIKTLRGTNNLLHLQLLVRVRSERCGITWIFIIYVTFYDTYM